MSSISDRASDYFFYEQNGVEKKVSNNLTPIQATNILNKVILSLDDKTLEEEVQEVIKFIKSR